jgi:hypothetical protein
MDPSRHSRCPASRIRCPLYLHDGRLIVADTVEFFNPVLGTKLSQQEKDDLVTYLMKRTHVGPQRIAQNRGIAAVVPARSDHGSGRVAWD